MLPQRIVGGIEPRQREVGEGDEGQPEHAGDDPDLDAQLEQPPRGAARPEPVRRGVIDGVFTDSVKFALRLLSILWILM